MGGDLTPTNEKRLREIHEAVTTELRLSKERAAFFESSADRWRAAFDHVVSALDETHPNTAAVLEEAERLRQSIPLEIG